MHKVPVYMNQMPAIRKRRYVMAFPDLVKQCADTSQTESPKQEKSTWPAKLPYRTQNRVVAHT